MCIGGSKVPAPPPPPSPPTPAPKKVDPAVQDARDQQKRRAAAASGQSGTILTSGQGLLSSASTTGTILGTA